MPRTQTVGAAVPPIPDRQDNILLRQRIADTDVFLRGLRPATERDNAALDRLLEDVRTLDPSTSQLDQEIDGDRWDGLS